jgi:hypothetical protein
MRWNHIRPGFSNWVQWQGISWKRKCMHCKSVPAQSQIWHTLWQSCLKWWTISHKWSIFCFTCVKYASPFFWHMVCQIRLKWSQQRIIVKHILHNMCQMWLCAGARFTVEGTTLIFLAASICMLMMRESSDCAHPSHMPSQYPLTGHYKD